MSSRGITTRKRYIAAYTGAFIVLALVVFSPFILQGRSFIWDLDGYTQHIKALSYYGMWLRGIVESVVSGQGFQVPTFAFSLGLGADVVGSLHYYVLGDPLNLLAVFVPERLTPVLYTALIVVRLYLAGLAFSLFVRTAFASSRTGQLAAALTYVFCGFALFAAVRHGYFANPLIYFPLVLYGVERVLRKRRHGVFALSVALCAVSNFYFFYMVFILMALYIAMRLIALHRKEGSAGWRNAFADFGRLVGAGVVGVLMACVVFVPVVMYFLQDSRVSVDSVVPLLYSAKYYSMMLLNLSTTSQPGNWTFLALGIVGLIAAVSVFAERKRNTQLKIALAACLVMLCIPFAGHVFNGFGYVTNRWCWAFCFVVSCAVAVRWEALTCLTRRQVVVLVALVFVYLAVCVVLTWGYMPHKGLLAAAGLWAVGVVAIAVAGRYNEKRKTPASGRVAGGMLFAVVCAGIVMNGLALYSSVGGGYSESFIPFANVAGIYDTEAQAVEDLNDAEEQAADEAGASGQNGGSSSDAKAGAADEADAGEETALSVSFGPLGDVYDAFFRYSASRDYATRNAGALTGIPSTTGYWSIANRYTKDFFLQMGIDGSDYKAYCWYDLNGQSPLYEIAGVRYFVAEDGHFVPYGYDATPEAEGELFDPKTGEERAYNIYENARPLPFAFTYDKVVDEDSFTALAPEKRREMVLQAATVAGAAGAASANDSGAANGLLGDMTVPADDLAFESTSVKYSIDLGDGVKEKDGKYSVAKDSSMTIRVKDAPANVEPSLQFTNLTMKASKTDCLIEATFRFANGDEQTRVVNPVRPEATDYEPVLWNTASPGYSESPLESIVLTFPLKGTFAWDDMQVIAQPMDAFNAQVSALSEDVPSQVDLRYLTEDTAATNRVGLSIALDQPKVLCTQIPFSDGWKVSVDGQPADILRLNLMFAGVALDAGEHEVEFTYETPGLALGSLLSLLGVALFVGLMLLQRRFSSKPRHAAKRHN